MRVKMSGRDQREFTCCCCFHVRTGTILLGIWNIVIQLLTLCLLIVVLIHPDVLVPTKTLTASDHPVSGDLTTQEPMYMAEVEIEHKDERHSYYDILFSLKKKKPTKEDKAIGFLVVTGYMILTGMMVYGAAKGRPGYLMPYFAIQVFDFSLSLLTAIGYFTYMPDSNTWHEHIPEAYQCDFFKNSQTRMLVTMTIVLFIMFFKAYLIGVVWSCYRYLSLQRAAHSVVQYMDAEAEPMLTPPKYEEVMKQSRVDMPPPPYTAQDS